MRARCELQPTITLTTNPTVQEARFAKRVGHGKSGVVFVNIYRSSGSGTVTFNIETASHTALRADTTNPFWVNAVTGGGNGFSAAITTGQALKFKVADLGEWVRYNITGVPSGGIDFDIVIYFADT